MSTVVVEGQMRRRFDGAVSKLRRRFTRARTGLLRWWPLRPLGMLLLASAALLGLRYGRREVDFLLYSAGLAAMALVVLALLATGAGSWWLHRRVGVIDTGAPPVGTTQEPQASGLTLPRPLPFLQIRLVWDNPQGTRVALVATRDGLNEVVTPTERGNFDLVSRLFSVEDVFGLARFSFTSTVHASRIVLPQAALSHVEIARARARGDAESDPYGEPEGDLVEMRAHAYGDSMRRVLWKVYARNRRLVVRLPERASAERPVRVAFFISGQGDEQTAGAARTFVEKGLLGTNYLFAADGADAAVRTSSEALEQLVESAAHRAEGGTVLARVGGSLDAQGLRSVLLFVPAVDGPWREKLRAFIQSRGIAPTVVVAGATDPTVGSWDSAFSLRTIVRRVMRRPSGEALAGTALTRLCAALAADGCSVTRVGGYEGVV